MAALLAWAGEGRLKHRVSFEDYARTMRLLVDRKAIGRVALVWRW